MRQFFKSGVVATSGLLLGTVFANVPIAAAQTSVVLDAPHDIGAVSVPSGILAYQDIVKASVGFETGRFVFVMDVSDAIPNSAARPPGAKLLEWSFRLRTDLTTCASGFPYPPGASTTSPEITHCSQYMVFIVSDGTGFTGMLIDRTPSLTGGDAVVTPISFNINGAEIVASVDAALVGHPQSFRWISRTETWFSRLGTLGYAVIDAAPDEGTFALWPND